jgi:hypothetical protein
LGIIPRSPTPIPLEERPLNELTTDELHELINRQRRELGELRDVKKVALEAKPRIDGQDDAGQREKPIVLDDQSSDDGDDIIEIVSVSKKRTAADAGLPDLPTSSDSE